MPDKSEALALLMRGRLLSILCSLPGNVDHKHVILSYSVVCRFPFLFGFQPILFTRGSACMGGICCSSGNRVRFELKEFDSI